MVTSKSIWQRALISGKESAKSLHYVSRLGAVFCAHQNADFGLDFFCVCTIWFHPKAWRFINYYNCTLYRKNDKRPGIYRFPRSSRYIILCWLNQVKVKNAFIYYAMFSPSNCIRYGSLYFLAELFNRSTSRRIWEAFRHSGIIAWRLCVYKYPAVLYKYVDI